MPLAYKLAEGDGIFNCFRIDKLVLGDRQERLISSIFPEGPWAFWLVKKDALRWLWGEMICCFTALDVLSDEQFVPSLTIMLHIQNNHLCHTTS